MADYGSSGIWSDGDTGPFRHGMVEHNDLNLPCELAAAFETWIDRYWGQKDWNQPEKELFNQQGRELAERLKAFVGVETLVVFQGEQWPAGIGPEELVP